MSKSNLSESDEVKSYLRTYIDDAKKKKYNIGKNLAYHKYKIILMCILIPIILLSLFLGGFFYGYGITSFADILSIVALGLSSITIVLQFVSLEDYPVGKLEISHLKENLYQLTFKIKNSGRGKLKIIKAFYLIEKRDTNKHKEFFSSKQVKMCDYFEELLEKIDKDNNAENMTLYSLPQIQYDHDVFFIHGDFHKETRIKPFEENKIFKITFYFLTSRQIYYYTPEYLTT